MNKYILFGAGVYARKAIELIGKDNIKFIVDNNPEKAGSLLDGIKIYYYKEKKIVLKTKL